MCLGVPGRVASITAVTEEAPLRMGVVSFEGVTKEICLAYVPEAEVGDWVIVHAGFAIQQVDEKEARRTIELLDTLEQPQ